LAYIVKISKIDIKFLIFSLGRPKDSRSSRSQNWSRIMLVQFWHEKMMRLRLRLLSNPYSLAYRVKKSKIYTNFFTT
jgi:hypothetical protein